MNGCSAQKNDSKPSSTAFLAMRPGSTRYAGSGMETPTFMSLSPHVASDLDDALELLPLLVLGQRVAVVRAGEAALGRQAQALQRHVLRGLVDPSPQRVLRLERARLGGDEPQHDLLVARQQAQRLEAARALGVPFHEIAVDVRREHRLHDLVGIAAGREPRAPEVAAARVHRHRHAGRAIRQRAVDEGGVGARQRGGIVAVGAEIVAHLRVAEIGPAHVVSRAMKSRCQKSRRYSPSVTARRPRDSCFATAARMHRSSTSLSCAAVRAPAFAFARASRSSGGRSRLPTWSARNGGFVTMATSQSKITPPSTLKDWPVMFRAPGDARKTASAATSSGSFGRPSGMAASRRRFISSTGTPAWRARVAAVSSDRAVTVVPGQTALTLMLCGASCWAAVRVSEITLPLLAA